MNWQPLIEFIVSVGYGLLSSVVPIFNSEIYIVASQVGGFTEEVTTAVGCAIGQTIGKAGTVVALRRGSRSGPVRRLRERRERPRKPVGRVRSRLGPGRTGCWGSWVNAGGGAHRLPLRLSRYSAAVCSDPGRARDPDVGHPLRCGRASRADGAVSRHCVRGLGIGRLNGFKITFGRAAKATETRSLPRG